MNEVLTRSSSIQNEQHSVFEITPSLHTIEASKIASFISSSTDCSPFTPFLLLADQNLCHPLKNLEEITKRRQITSPEIQEQDFFFPGRSIFVDMSRGPVYKPEFITSLIDTLSKQGGTSLCLYTEAIEMDEYPHLHGKNTLSKGELSDIARYGKNHGITVYPAIQTLAHMERVLVHPEFKDFALPNSSTTIDPANPQVYSNFLYPLLRNAAEPYRVNGKVRMNIGCDESFFISPELYAYHLEKMQEICTDLAIDGEIWADQIVAMDKITRMKIPRTFPLVYWEYDETDPDFIIKDLESLKEDGFTVRSASASAFTHNQFYPDIIQAKENIIAVTTAARKAIIPEVALTYWHDDGGEAPFRTATELLPFFFNQTRKLPEEVHSRDGSKAQVFFNTIYDASKRHEKDYITPNPLKIIFYENMFSRHFTKNLSPVLSKKLESLQNEIMDSVSDKDPLTALYLEKLSNFISMKVSLSQKIEQSSPSSKVVRDLAKKGLSSLFEMWLIHQHLWDRERLPDGFEALNMRYLSLANQLFALQSGAHSLIFSQEKIQTSFPNAWRTYKDIAI